MGHDTWWGSGAGEFGPIRIALRAQALATPDPDLTGSLEPAVVCEFRT
jgi:hypothetical protein